MSDHKLNINNDSLRPVAGEWFALYSFTTTWLHSGHAGLHVEFIEARVTSWMTYRYTERGECHYYTSDEPGAVVSYKGKLLSPELNCNVHDKSTGLTGVFRGYYVLQDLEAAKKRITAELVDEYNMKQREVAQCQQ